MDRPSQIQAIPILYLLSTEAHQVVMYSNKQLLLHLAHQTIPQLHVFSIFTASLQLTHSAQLGHLPPRVRRLLPALPSWAAAARRPACGHRASPFSQAFAAAPPSAPFRLSDRTWRGKRNRWEEQWQCRRRVNPRSSSESAPLEHRSEEEQLISDGGACSERHHCLLGRMLSSKGRLASSSRTSLLGLGRVEHVSTRCQRGIGD